MKILVVGGGSIGLRHARNLKSLGVSEVTILEKDPSRSRLIESEGFSTTQLSLPECLKPVWNAVFLCTPTNLHGEQTLEVMKVGYPLFIEKPVAHSEAMAELLRRELSLDTVSMVGCNMRFHPGPKRIKQLLEEGHIGQPLFGRFHSGSYLPNWRPGTDYKKSYSAIASEGGGCLLDCIHEIDLATWMLGDISKVFCHSINSKSIDIQAEDIASLICFQSNGVFSEIHLDYVQKTYERGCEIIGTNGRIDWNMETGAVRMYVATKGKWTSFQQPEGWDLNQMYIDEISHFLSCIQGKKESTCPIRVALKTLDTVLAAKRSTKNGQIEFLDPKNESDKSMLARAA